jgi:FkbM family methyltransferase
VTGKLSQTPDGRRISFAQNGEDIVLLRVFGSQPTGVWVDVGANHPVNDSVTKNFHDMGWTGINLEPVPTLFDLLVEMRPNDVNLCMAASDTDGVMTFHRNTTNPDLSTFTTDWANRYRAEGHDVVDVDVPVARLATVCDQYLPAGVIDFMKVDTEGHELDVLRGHDFARHRVRVVLAEATPDRLGELVDHLAGHEMRFVTFDGLNAWFVVDDEYDQLAPVVALPPSAILDWFHPAIYMDMIDQREVRIAGLMRQVEHLQALAADSGTAIGTDTGTDT